MFLSRADVRDLDRRAEANGLPTRVLMESAGRGMADIILQVGATGRILVCCGKGNNGGDGLVAARHLASRGAKVNVLLFAPATDLTGAAADNWQALNGTNVPAQVAWPFDETHVAAELKQATWLIDALFGIGLTTPVRPPFDRLIDAINASGKPIVALDVPSGLDADTGEPLGPTIRARHTATCVAPKKGFANPASAAWTGEVHVIDLGLGTM